MLVDLSGSPKVLGTLTPSGDYVDARLVGSTVRLVVRSQPNLGIPERDRSALFRPGKACGVSAAAV